MNVSTEEKIIQQKIKELSGLIEQREVLQKKINKIETAIRAFIELLEDETDQKLYLANLKIASKPVGLTESIKKVFRDADEKGENLTPTDVKNKLAVGFPLLGYSNPLAVVYTTMIRLEEQGVIVQTDEKIRGIFKWKLAKNV